VASVDKKRDIESVAKEISSLLTSETLSQSIKKGTLSQWTRSGTLSPLTRLLSDCTTNYSWTWSCMSKFWWKMLNRVVLCVAEVIGIDGSCKQLMVMEAFV
jgi:hypothetical protein